MADSKPSPSSSSAAAAAAAAAAATSAAATSAATAATSAAATSAATAATSAAATSASAAATGKDSGTDNDDDDDDDDEDRSGSNTDSNDEASSKSKSKSKSSKLSAGPNQPPEIWVHAQPSRFHVDIGDNTTIGEVDLKDVCIEISGKEILKGAHLHFFPGHRYGLIGRNGVGKSTLMRQMALVSHVFLRCVCVCVCVCGCVLKGAVWARAR